MEKVVIGIDISKEKLDLCVMVSMEVRSQFVIENKQIAINKKLRLLQKEYGVEAYDLIVCAEYTGMYIYPLVCACTDADIFLWMENPTEIKLSNGMQRGKNDSIDAFRIALYCSRFIDKAHRYTMLDKDLSTLKTLLKEREMYIVDKSKYNAQLKDQKRFMDHVEYMRKKVHVQRILKALEKSLIEIDKQVDIVIANNPIIKKQSDLLQTIDGVGKQLSIQMIVVSHCFEKFQNYRQFCCYAGLAPFQYTSGGSIHSKSRVSKKANKRIKSLIHMGALAAARNKKTGEMKDYYERKVSEGKNPMLVLNAVRAKMVARMFAVVRHEKPYDSSYLTTLKKVA
jgi:transposase